MKRSMVKDAMKIGFGLMVGKNLGDFVVDVAYRVIYKFMERSLKDAAKNGSEVAKQFCEEEGVEFKSEMKDTVDCSNSEEKE